MSCDSCEAVGRRAASTFRSPLSSPVSSQAMSAIGIVPASMKRSQASADTRQDLLQAIRERYRGGQKGLSAHRRAFKNLVGGSVLPVTLERKRGARGNNGESDSATTTSLSLASSTHSSPGLFHDSLRPVFGRETMRSKPSGSRKTPRRPATRRGDGGPTPVPTTLSRSSVFPACGAVSCPNARLASASVVNNPR